jgi:hypothetical protein
LQKIIEEGSPERLEAEVKRYMDFLDLLNKPLAEKASEIQDAGYFLK